jgi:hypothetical protein
MADQQKCTPKEFLGKLYAREGKTTDAEKISLLSELVDGKAFSFFACGGEVTEKMKLNMLEREYLIQEEQLVPQLV